LSKGNKEVVKMKLSKEQLESQIQELENNIAFIKTHSDKTYFGNPKGAVLKRYNMRIWSLRKKLANL
jgi:hypothetical protein